MLWWRSSRTVLIVSPREVDERIHVPFLRQPQIRLLNGFPDERAMAIATNERPQLIIDELADESAEAVEFGVKVRTDPGTCSIPLIVVAEPPMAASGESVRADEILHTPLGPGQLFEAVRRFVPLPKRRHDRIRLNLRFTYSRNGKQAQAFSRDLSSQGAFLKSDRRYSVGTRVDLSFRLPGMTRDIVCHGVVRSLDEAPGGGFGLQFDELSGEDYELLQGFIEAKRHRFLRR